MNVVEEYAKRWAKPEKEDTDTLSEWIKSGRCMLESRIKLLKRCMKTNYPSIFNN